jgi:maltose-binding protein MalE
MFPWNYYFLTKQDKSDEIKRELFTQGEVPVLVYSPQVWEHPETHTLRCPSLKRMHLYKNLPTTKSTLKKNRNVYGGHLPTCMNFPPRNCKGYYA